MLDNQVKSLNRSKVTEHLKERSPRQAKSSKGVNSRQRKSSKKVKFRQTQLVRQTKY